MESVAAVLGLFFMLAAFVAAFFLLVVQPIWSIVRMAVSPRLSSGAKAALIVLTLVLLGPLLTFFYALFGTESKALRASTIVGALVFVVAAGGVLGMAAIADTAAPTAGALADADMMDLAPLP